MRVLGRVGWARWRPWGLRPREKLHQLNGHRNLCRGRHGQGWIGHRAGVSEAEEWYMQRSWSRGNLSMQLGVGLCSEVEGEVGAS